MSNPVHETDPGIAYHRSNTPERTAEYGMIPGLAEKCPRETTLEMWRRICFVRYFEYCVREAHMRKDVQCLIYLGVGQESIAAATSVAMEDAWVTFQHRCHTLYLAFGGNPTALVDELLGLPTGCNKGMGGSNCLQDIDNKIVGHNGLIGDNVPVACGVAYVKRNEKHICFFGDGAAEEDYVMGALAFAATHKLPILFICDDNDLSVLTPTKDRRNWKVHELAKSLGMPAVDITDDPWLIEHYSREFSENLPALINIRECREFWHQGTGVDGDPEWNRFTLVKSKLADLGLASEAEKIEAEMKEKAQNLWNERLRIRSAN